MSVGTAGLAVAQAGGGALPRRATAGGAGELPLVAAVGAGHLDAEVGPAAADFLRAPRAAASTERLRGQGVAGA